MKKTISVILVLSLILAFGTLALPVRAASEEEPSSGEETVYDSVTEAAEAVRQAIQEKKESVTVCISFDPDDYEGNEETDDPRVSAALSIEADLRRRLAIDFAYQAIGRKPVLVFGTCSAHVSWYTEGDIYAARIEYAFEYSVLESMESAADTLLEAWRAKKNHVTMYVRTSLPEGADAYDWRESVWQEILDLVSAHTGSLEGGDSIRRQITDLASETFYFESGDCIVGIQLFFPYYLINDAFDSELERVMDSLELEGKSEYEKVLAVYSYVTGTVEYDTEGENPRRYTAYGALIDKLAVCDGISQLVNRMMLSAGIDCRIILGSTPRAGVDEWEYHGWNIVRIGDDYYNIDATWDLGREPGGYVYFLKSYYVYNTFNQTHLRSAEYSTEEFKSRYPMACQDYGDDTPWIEESGIYKITLDTEGFYHGIFEAPRSGRYTIRLVDAPRKVRAWTVNPGEWNETYHPLDPVETTIGNDYAITYWFNKDFRYNLTFIFEDRLPGTFSFQVTKDPVADVSIREISVEDITFLEGTGTPTKAWKEGSWEGELDQFIRYDPLDAPARVVLSNDEVLEGPLNDLMDRLEDEYELEFSVSMLGAVQKYDYQWSIGAHDVTIFLNDFILPCRVTVAENPVRSVAVEDLLPLYDDETYSGSTVDGGNSYYHFPYGNITVTTDEKTYTGPYEDVYRALCEDIGYVFPYTPELMAVAGGLGLGTHAQKTWLFGVLTECRFEILQRNPVKSIHVMNRIVTENDRREVQAEVPDGNGGTETITYLAYSYEPEQITIEYGANGSFTGTPEEVQDYLANSTFDYHEAFTYMGQETYSHRWATPGEYTVTISLGDVSAQYMVFVKSKDDTQLPSDGNAAAEITKPGETVYFTFTPDCNSPNDVFAISSVNAEYPLAACLYDENMNLLDSDNTGGEKTGFSVSYGFSRGVSYYISVRYCGEQTGRIEIQTERVFGLNRCIVGGEMTLYEIDSRLREEITDGKNVQYMWYDLYPRYTISLSISVPPYDLSGTLDEVTTAVRELFGFDPKISVVNYQSYSNPWTVGGVYDSYVHIWGEYWSGPNITIKQGPILTLDAEDVVHLAGTGQTMTRADGSVWYLYDTMPVLLTAHTVDGDIQGSPAEIQQHLKDTYGITVDYAFSGDDQSGDSLWGTGSHNMTFTIGNVSADYRVIIDSVEGISVSGGYKTDYLVGDELDSAGITVTASMVSGSTADVTADASFSGLESSSAGEKTVTVRYGDRETTFTVTVRNRVTLSVLGDVRHTVESAEDVHGLLAGGLSEWLSPTEYASDSGETVFDMIVRVLGGEDAVSVYHRPRDGGGAEYIYAAEKNGLTLTEGQNHDSSRWMIAVNGTSVQDEATALTLANGDSVTLYWCDNPAWDMTADMWQAAVVTAMIEAIGELTPESEPAIVAAWMAYEALTAEQKAFVTNHSLLIIAQETVTYTVDYDANGGTGAPTSQSKTLGYPLTLHTEIPVRADMSEEGYVVTFDANGGSVDTEQLTNERTTVYTFTQWNTAANGSGTGYAPGGEYSGNADVTMYAQWTEDTITASVMLPTPTRDGYTFKGWGTSADATRGVTGHYTPSGDETLYAVWERNAPETYTVTYDANGGTGAPDDQIKTHGTDLTLSRTEPTRADAPAGSFTVTLDANGGIVDPAELYAERTTKYAFETWNTEPDGSGTNFKPGEKYKANESVTLYAQWTEDTITASVTLPTPTREGYTFDGWGSSTAADTGITGSFTPWESGKLYALWKEDSVPQDRFTDVPEDSWYSDAVYWAKENGITTGTTPTTFSPNAACTRAQIVTFLWRVKGEPEPASYSNPFRDVPSDAWYAKAVLWAYHGKITTGTSAITFSPNQACTRAQSVTFLWRAAGSPNAAVGNKFKDVKGDAWYAKAVYWAYNNGITTGTSGTAFSPNASCSRAQIVTFLYRYAG